MKVHLVAICGTGMGSLAGLMKAAGHEVSGSDKAFYPPMSERLEAWGIPTVQGFDAEHVSSDADMVVVGNACRKDNPEAQAAMDAGIQVMSFPQALAELFIKKKRSLVVAGTHGKTTTTGLLGYLLVELGRDPSFLVGGIPLNFGRSFRLGQGSEFAVEGDEYDSAFFDKRPKFVHYRPDTLVLTSVEFDHADIYQDMEAYRSSFRKLLQDMPADGLVIACTDDPEVRELVKSAGCPVTSYGLESGCDWQAGNLIESERGNSFELIVAGQNQGRLETPLSGRHNAANCLASLVVLDRLGALPETVEGIRSVLDGFQGMARRMQERGTVDEVTVVDDFAHHPTEVLETVRAARKRYPGKRLVAVFEPRTNTSRRAIFQDRYPGSFEAADRVIIVPPFGVDTIPAGERFDSEALVTDLRARQQDASLLLDADAVVTDLKTSLFGPAVVLIMSNGAFGDIHRKLLASLRSRSGV